MKETDSRRENMKCTQSFPTLKTKKQNYRILMVGIVSYSISNNVKVDTGNPFLLVENGEDVQQGFMWLNETN